MIVRENEVFVYHHKVSPPPMIRKKHYNNYCGQNKFIIWKTSHWEPCDRYKSFSVGFLLNDCAYVLFFATYLPDLVANLHSID